MTAKYSKIVTISHNPDMITIGTPMNGQIKVCGDFDNPSAFVDKISAAIKILKGTKANMGENV